MPRRYTDGPDLAENSQSRTQVIAGHAGLWDTSDPKMSKNSPPPPPPSDPRPPVIDAHKKLRLEARTKRVALLKSIAAERHSTVISYVTANRGLINAQIGSDVIRFFRDLLGAIGHVEKLDLLLITRGGNTLTPLRLVSLLREFAGKVAVLVPYMAHSAGTLITLGADEIVMGAMGELGPVDPSVTNPFNPILPQEDIQGTVSPKPRPRIPISVEDVASYLNFAKTRGELGPEGMAQAFSALTQNVHPLALGNILRHHNLIRHLARTLLLMHMDADADKGKLESVVRKLTEELYSHEYTITRDEASVLGLTSSNRLTRLRSRCGTSSASTRDHWASIVRST